MRAFLRNKIESTDFEKADEKTKKRIYKYMMKGEIFEVWKKKKKKFFFIYFFFKQFLNTKFGSTKRFGFEKRKKF